MTQKKYEIHVISNTHWDREWLYNFQETRMMLVEFIDGLLDILDKEPRYKSFLLDSQAVPIEDYLEVRPENRGRIEKHVSTGRILVGPWYTCPEAFNVTGESLVRNLLYGHRVAQQFGAVMKVGHTPFSYGQNSQMPQIYAGFGIDTILFYHGVSHDEAPNEFIFEGADGTQILGTQMSSMARYNYYHLVYRPVVCNAGVYERTYAWAKGGLPFHLCNEDHCLEHHFLLDPPKHFSRARLKKCVQELRDAEAAVATTKYLAFMMGHDSSVADEVELKLIDAAQQFVGDDTLFHSSLPDLMDKVKKAVGNLPVLKGERRTPKLMDGRMHLYSDVLSSRTRMKRLSAHAEHALQRWAEPYAALAWSLGAKYPASLLDLAWKTLLKCHAHDSIAGAGVDEIERDVTCRLRQVVNIARGLTCRSLGHIQHTIDNSDAGRDDVLLTVFNASPHPRSEVLTAVVDVPATSAAQQFDLVEAGRNRRVPVQAAGRRPHGAVINHPGDATAMMDCEQVTFHLDAHDIPALGYTTLRLDPKGVFGRGGLVCGHNAFENEHMWAHINVDGTLAIEHKATGTVFDGLHYFEDGGEAGHAWMHIEPAIDAIVSSRGFPVAVALEENGPLLARYRITYRMTIPAGLDENGGDPCQRLDGAGSSARRTLETRELVITSAVTLRKGARSLEVRTRFENPAESHRLRVMFPTNLSKAKTCHVESAFDVVERPIEHGPDSPWYGGVNATFPMQRFVDVSDGKAGLAIINDGLREYEVIPGPERTIALTLLRAYEVALTTVAWRWEPHPEMKLSQCPGQHEFRYLIYPHAGRWDAAEVYREVERLAVPIELAQVGPHRGDMPKRHSFLEIQPANLVLSALKQSEDGEALTLRIFNPTEKRIDGTVKFFRRIRSAELVSFEEKPLRKLESRGKSIKLRVDKKKVVTINVRLS